MLTRGDGVEGTGAERELADGMTERRSDTAIALVAFGGSDWD